MLDHVLAKYKKDKSTGKVEKETLIQHTNYVLDAFKKLKSRTHGFPDSFWEAAYIMCLFHDSGKISENFKDVLDGKYEENIRHEMLSAAFLMYFDKTFVKEKNQFTVAIYSHHKRLNSELFDNDQFKELRLSEENLVSWYNFVAEKLKEHSKVDNNIISKLLNFSSKDYRSKIFKPFYDRNKVTWDERDRCEYIKSKAVLNIADWSASGHFDLSKSFTYSTEEFHELLAKKLLAEKRISTEKEFSFRKFQADSIVDQNVLAIAPTGSGKTEASLLWASQKEQFDKIIYCLPTRVTSNAIYQRLAGYFEKENCSVVHSSALLYQKEVDQDYDSRRYLRDKTFFSNITVCTIDQILTQGFNLGFWEVKTFHCRNARIIIDEIHLYQPYTLALILKSIEYLRTKFNARFYTMSATMPSKLRHLLELALGGSSNFTLIEDTELLKKSRNTFEVRNKMVQENIDELKQAIKTKNKVLVVVNTVDQAINLYQDLKGFAKKKKKECICFHSRFIQKDRNEKEQDIIQFEKEGRDILLIATQVVEVSLDIDFDILFTENAPIDAVIQRAGRVNRKRNSERDSKVIIHQHSDVTQKYVYTEEDILENTFQAFESRNGDKITEEEFLNLVDQVYEKIEITEKPSFKEGWNVYHEIQSHYHYLGDCPPDNENAMTRDGLDTISVIPDKFYEELYDKGKTEKSKYELSIQKKRFNSARSRPDKDGFKYIQYDYESDIGMIFNTNNEENQSSTFQTY